MANPGNEHSEWSASATERNWSCAGALAMTRGRPDESSEAADWGTAAHAIAASCLGSLADASEWIGKTVKGKRHSFVVDDEMAETVQTYVDYCRTLMPGAKFWIEERFYLNDLKPPFEAGGTADFVAFDPKRRLLRVVDFKGGRGVVVSAKDNKQMRTYALGALLKHPGLAVDQVETTIVQPRANHPEGIIRSETIHAADLLEWTADLLLAMRRAAQAIRDLETAKAKNLMHAWFDYLTAGDHCQFCPAAGDCPALRNRALAKANVWFDDLDRPQPSRIDPASLAPQQIADLLDAFDGIQEWMNAVRFHARRQAESGVAIPGYQLAEKIGNRAWKDEDAALAALAGLGVPETKRYTHKIVSPAQADKLVGAKNKAALAPLYERPLRGTNLVAVNKTTRPALPPAVERHLEVLPPE